MVCHASDVEGDFKVSCRGVFCNGGCELVLLVAAGCDPVSFFRLDVHDARVPGPPGLFPLCAVSDFILRRVYQAIDYQDAAATKIVTFIEQFCSHGV